MKVLEKESLENEKDWFLQTLVDSVNNSELTINLTILTHGFIVFGNLIGGKEYFKGIGEEFENGIGKNDKANSFVKQFEKIGNDIYSNKDEKKNPMPTYIHLKDAKFYHPNQKPIPNNRGVWWRGRLTEISGFSLGRLNIDYNE